MVKKRQQALGVSKNRRQVNPSTSATQAAVKGCGLVKTRLNSSPGNRTKHGLAAVQKFNDLTLMTVQNVQTVQSLRSVQPGFRS
jgi:hypothetical protein